jgi:uncharacterized protein YbjT (DUF2867 family)
MDEDQMSERRILLTGATGFVGAAVHPALVAAGWQVRCLTRNEPAAKRRWPKLQWVAGDIADPGAMARALQGCEAALYLVHGMGEGGDFRRRDREGARHFSLATASAGVRRIVYLGGTAPDADGNSPHLRSRLEVGEVLRRGRVPALELRASMIVGHRSLSWLIVRDLAARLPVMVLPAWLRSRTQPIAIDDVVLALVRALEVPLNASTWFDIGGPDVLSGKQILDETATVLGLHRPWTIALPVLTPRLSSLWVRFVTRARWSVAREVVVGLSHDLLARDDRFWSLIDHGRRLHFVEAARRALAAEAAESPMTGAWGVVERARRPAVVQAPG